MRMDDYRHDDFTWYGPAGIGSTRGVDGFRAYHQGPFLEAFLDRAVEMRVIDVFERLAATPRSLRR
jgi:hypothetical protein